MSLSSQASSELSSASFRVVSTALVGDEKPTCCKFLAKYSAVLLVVICLADFLTLSITSRAASTSTSGSVAFLPVFFFAKVDSAKAGDFFAFLVGLCAMVLQFSQSSMPLDAGCLAGSDTQC